MDEELQKTAARYAQYKMVGFKPEIRGTADFYNREESRREWAAQKAGISIDMESQEGKELAEKSWEIQLSYVPRLEDCQTLGELTDTLGDMIADYGELGNNLDKAMFYSIVGKARNQIGDHLDLYGHTDMVIEMFQASEDWENIQEASTWIDERILSRFPENHDFLVKAARDIFVTDIRNANERASL